METGELGNWGTGELGKRLRPERGAKPPSESAWGCPPPLVAEQAGDQLRRGLAVARMDCRRAEAEGPKRTE